MGVLPSCLFAVSQTLAAPSPALDPACASNHILWKVRANARNEHRMDGNGGLRLARRHVDRHNLYYDYPHEPVRLRKYCWSCTARRGEVLTNPALGKIRRSVI